MVAITKVFPGEFPFISEYDQRSYESNIVEPYASMAQFECINTSITANVPLWSPYNTIQTQRQGPYWQQNPSLIRQSHLLCACITSSQNKY